MGRKKATGKRTSTPKAQAKKKEEVDWIISAFIIAMLIC